MGQALSRAEGAQQAAAASLFAGWQEKLIASALEGAMGGVRTRPAARWLNAGIFCSLKRGTARLRETC